MPLYSIKMRASAHGAHISGAEKIIPDSRIPANASGLLQRGLTHPKGRPDMLNIKIERLQDEDILYLDALPVNTVEVSDVREGVQEIRKFLNALFLENTENIIALLPEMNSMRGALLLDVDTLERLEPDPERGVRATYMDQETGPQNPKAACGAHKDHYQQ